MLKRTEKDSYIVDAVIANVRDLMTDAMPDTSNLWSLVLVSLFSNANETHRIY